MKPGIKKPGFGVVPFLRLRRAAAEGPALRLRLPPPPADSLPVGRILPRDLFSLQVRVHKVPVDEFLDEAAVSGPGSVIR